MDSARLTLKTSYDILFPSKSRHAVLAQLVERIHGKDEVSGSIPEDGSKKQPIRAVFFILSITVLANLFLYKQAVLDMQTLHSLLQKLQKY